MYRILTIGLLVAAPLAFQPTVASANDGERLDGKYYQTVDYRHRGYSQGHYHHHHYRPYGYNDYYYSPYRSYYYTPYRSHYYHHHHHGHSHFDVHTPWFRFHIH